MSEDITIAQTPNQKSLETCVRAIAFYLPQYHPVRENDQWWGKGFTEWTNVVKAKPLFRGHNQPRFPVDLGYYDLRVPEVREAQAELATGAGIEGFCYYHYWFGRGRKLLERPFAEVVSSGRPDFPFCLAWANESWTGIWHGLTDKTLIEQRYDGVCDYKAHFDDLRAAFGDRRYLKISGKNIFVVYRPLRLPNPPEFIRSWQRMAAAASLPQFYFIGMGGADWDHAGDGFDAKIIDKFIFSSEERSISNRSKLERKIWGKFFKPARPRQVKYSAVTADLDQKQLSDGLFSFPTVIADWDNTPRSGLNGLVFTEFSVDRYESHLKKAVNYVGQRQNFEERLVFVKSWNEWAEGNYLEPDRRNGHLLLDVTRRCVLENKLVGPINYKKGA